MKITFIHHSSFCVEIEDMIFIFDYFPGDKMPGYHFKGMLPTFKPDQKIVVFSSHQHGDHFDMEIFKWSEKYKNIQYVLSHDIKISDNYLRKNGIDISVREKIHFMKPNTELTLEETKIETLLSTDDGVAFLVTYGETTLFHAGDLHWWHWEGEGETFKAYQEKTYKWQIEKIAKRNIEVAFVVLDGRLKDQTFWGIDYFMKNTKAKHVIPMHLWQDYALISAYKGQAETFAERIVEVERENQVFSF
ncbi:MBL fold metallo-hydrolase [Lachnospiraceae bacterium ZAX-1]